jgi:hypothetical protein
VAAAVVVVAAAVVVAAFAVVVAAVSPAVTAGVTPEADSTAAIAQALTGVPAAPMVVALVVA